MSQIVLLSLDDNAPELLVTFCRQHAEVIVAQAGDKWIVCKSRDSWTPVEPAADVIRRRLEVLLTVPKPRVFGEVAPGGVFTFACEAVASKSGLFQKADFDGAVAWSLTDGTEVRPDLATPVVPQCLIGPWPADWRPFAAIAIGTEFMLAGRGHMLYVKESLTTARVSRGACGHDCVAIPGVVAVLPKR